jgi:tRNA nucleotidyltransferase (CCA-adding enzyme)
MQSDPPSLLRRLETQATPDERRLLDAVRSVSAARDAPAYLVGGSVRDLLLGHAPPDLDITVEGDAVVIAGEVAGLLGDARLTVHQAFGTATVRFGDSYVDLITARRERYPAPGALPVVTPSDLNDDLARRDFSMNAMAIGVAGPRMGVLIDPFGGRADLEAGTIRMLHDRAFQDDATRLLRAARYTGRFRLSLDDATARAARRDRAYLATISPARVRNEIVRQFAEARPVRGLRVMEQLDLPAALVDGLRFGPTALAGWARLSREEWRDRILPWLLPVLTWPADRLEVYINRFALTHAEARAVRTLPRARAALTRLARRDLRRSEIAARLDPLQPTVLVAWARAAPHTARGRIAARYLEDVQGVRSGLNAADLRALGVPEGPAFGRVLRALRAARLDDPALTLDGERRIVEHMLKQQPGV